jgi:hypothetical protein
MANDDQHGGSSGHSGHSATGAVLGLSLRQGLPAAPRFAALQPLDELLMWEDHDALRQRDNDVTLDHLDTRHAFSCPFGDSTGRGCVGVAIVTCHLTTTMRAFSLPFPPIALR